MSNQEINYYTELESLFNKYTIGKEIVYSIYSKPYNPNFENEINYENNEIDILYVKKLIQNEFSAISENKSTDEENKILKIALDSIMNAVMDTVQCHIYKINNLYDYDLSVTGLGFIVFNKDIPYKVLMFGASD